MQFNQRNFMNKLTLALGLSLGLSLAYAHTPSALRDLERADWDRVNNELRARGWTFIDSHWDDQLEGTVGYWWSPSEGRCVKTRTRGQTVRHIDLTAATDCNQYGSHSYDRDSDEDHDSKAALAVGAAALLGIAALSHRSHHRDDRHNDERSTADFERGYRDGLHHYGYDYPNANDAYRDGYSKGRDEREHRGRHRDDRGSYRASSSSGSAEWFTRLPGASGGGMENQMRINGFELVDTFGSGNDGNGSVWYNRDRRQCLQVIVVGGRVDSAVDIGQHPRCR